MREPIITLPLPLPLTSPRRRRLGQQGDDA
jgi:hypothetical protein